jgi:hypothetical protein
MTPPARRPGDEIQSAGYARRSHPHAIADVGSIPTVSIRTALLARGSQEEQQRAASRAVRGILTDVAGTDGLDAGHASGQSPARSRSPDQAAPSRLELRLATRARSDRAR